MFIHIFSFRWRPSVIQAERDRAEKEIMALKDQIAEIRQLSLGRNVSGNSPGYTTTGVMTFDSLDAYVAYVSHAAHVSLVQWLGPLVEPIELDFEEILH